MISTLKRTKGNKQKGAEPKICAKLVEAPNGLESTGNHDSDNELLKKKRLGLFKD